jgi:lysozyme
MRGVEYRQRREDGAAQMNVYDVLKRDEGLRLKPYRCTAGKLTIGYGRNLDDRGISQQEAETLLRNDVADAYAECRREFPWFSGLDEAREAIVVSMVFNLGMAKFKGFHNTIAAIARGDYQDAASRMLQSRWAQQVGNRAIRLAAAMRTGVLE